MARLRRWDAEKYNGKAFAHLSDQQLEDYVVARFPWLARSHGPGWKFIHAQVTAIQDVLYPHDPAVVRAIQREFDPRVVPLFVRRTYLSKTGGVRTYGFHCVGSYLWNPTMKPAPWCERVMKPTSGAPIRVTQMDAHFEDRTKRKPGLPGEYLQFGWGIYRELRGRYQEWSAKQAQKFLQENDEASRARKAREKAAENVAAKVKSDQRMMRPHFEGIDKHDIERLLAEHKEPERKPAVGPW